jgi:hypothetical protein
MAKQLAFCQIYKMLINEVGPFNSINDVNNKGKENNNKLVQVEFTNTTEEKTLMIVDNENGQRVYLFIFSKYFFKGF